MAVANIIRESRKSSKHTQKDLANAIGVDTKTIRNIEISGNCSLEVALRLSMYFDKSVNELFHILDSNPSFCCDNNHPLGRTKTSNKDSYTTGLLSQETKA